MTGQDIVDAVRAEVNEPNPAFFTTPSLLRWLNRGQLSYVRRTTCLQNFATTSTVAGQADYPMPDDWLSAEKVFYNFPVNGVDSWNPLKPTSIEKLAQENPNFLSTDASMLGRPQKYYIVNRTLYVFPRPQTSGNNDVFMFYESKPVTLTTLASDISIDDSLAEGLEAYLLSKMWKKDEEPDKAKEEKDRFEFEVGRGLAWKKKRVLDGKWKIDIESFLPFNYSSVNNSAFNNQLNPLNL